MITIRRANKNEVAELQRLNNEVFIDNEKYDQDLDMDWAKGPHGEKYFQELVNDEASLCLIAEDKEQKVGYLAAGPKNIDYRKSRYIEIQNMGIIPAYRSQGIGRQLMAAATEWAKTHGFQKVFVTSYAKNQKAIDFYRQIGFSEIDISLEMPLS